MDAKQLIETFKMAQKIGRAVAKAKAPTHQVEAYLAEIEYTLAQMQAYLESEAQRIMDERKASK